MGRRDSVVTGPRRLGVRRLQLFVWFTFPAVAVIGMAFAAASNSGLEQLSAAVFAAEAAIVPALVCVAVLRPRRRVDAPVAVDGTIVVMGSRLLAALILLAWALMVVLAAVWVAILVLDGSFGSPVWMVIAIVGVLLSLPDAWRLVTGRLHLWRVELTPDAMNYRGYRSAHTVPWSALRGVSEQTTDPAGVLVGRKGQAEDFVIPALAFTMPADQLVELIGAHQRRS